MEAGRREGEGGADEAVAAILGLMARLPVGPADVAAIRADLEAQAGAAAVVGALDLGFTGPSAPTPDSWREWIVARAPDAAAGDR